MQYTRNPHVNDLNSAHPSFFFFFPEINTQGKEQLQTQFVFSNYWVEVAHQEPFQNSDDYKKSLQGLYLSEKT